MGKNSSCYEEMRLIVLPFVPQKEKEMIMKLCSVYWQNCGCAMRKINPVVMFANINLQKQKMSLRNGKTR